jgi:uncharacterized protein YidB (DUF937 family)
MGGGDDLIGGATGGNGRGLGDLLGGLAGSASGGGGLDGLLGSLSGSGARAGGIGGLLTALVPAVSGMLAGGGLKNVLAGFEANGLGAQAATWVGTGANAPIGAADVEKVVGHEQLAGIARELGVSEPDAAAAVARVLPAVVDHVTPDGTVPPEDEVDAALGGSRAVG